MSRSLDRRHLFKTDLQSAEENLEHWRMHRLLRNLRRRSSTKEELRLQMLDRDLSEVQRLTSNQCVLVLQNKLSLRHFIDFDHEIWFFITDRRSIRHSHLNEWSRFERLEIVRRRHLSARALNAIARRRRSQISRSSFLSNYLSSSRARFRTRVYFSRSIRTFRIEISLTIFE